MEAETAAKNWTWNNENKEKLVAEQCKWFFEERHESNKTNNMGIESKEEYHRVKNTFKELLLEDKGLVEILKVIVQKI